MNNYIKIEIANLTQVAIDLLVADLSDLNFYAFEEEETSLLAYIKEEDFDEAQLKATPGLGDFKKTVIVGENWNEQWESGYHPVIVNDFAAIRASFHEPVASVKHELIITPKMSFGTGHHATTFLMVEMMEQVNFENKTVLDFGTGTGVLSILAEKLGASRVLAIDYDEWSINNTLENIEANNCKNISVEKRDNLEGLSIVDIIIANINLNVLGGASSSISALLQSGALLLTSGFLVKDETAMISIFEERHFIKKVVLQKEGWLAILFEKL